MDDSSSLAGSYSSYKVQFCFYICFVHKSLGCESSASSGISVTDQEIGRLREEVASLCKEKQSLQSELQHLEREKESVSSFSVIFGSLVYFL